MLCCDVYVLYECVHARTRLFHNNFSFVNLLLFVLRWGVCMCFFLYFHSTNQKLFEANIKWFRFFISSQYIFLRFLLISRCCFVSDLHQPVVVVGWVCVCVCMFVVCCCRTICCCFVFVFAFAPLASLIISQSYASMHLFPLVYIS